MPRGNVVQTDENDSEELLQTAGKWQTLFGYTYSDAIDAIEKHRRNLSRSRVSKELWDLIKAEYEFRGYDREAYEHELELGSKRSQPAKKQQANVHHSELKGRFLVQLTDTLSPATIRAHARLEKDPDIVEGYGDGGKARFCLVDGSTKFALLDNESWPSFKSTIICVPQPAEKRLSPDSAYPTLGLDTTLPQHRPSRLPAGVLPEQDQYPVWYFFYGTLAEPDRLMSLLSLPEDPVFVPAKIRGGVLKTWAGKYKGLVDGPSNAEVRGTAYMVTSKEHEDALRTYETDNYEVVRCVLEMGDRKLPGCTFRFLGDVGE